MTTKRTRKAKVLTAAERQQAEAGAVSSRAVTMELALVSTSARRNIRGERLPENALVDVKTTGELKAEDRKVFVNVDYNFHVDYTDERKEGGPGVEIKAFYSVTYTLADVAGITAQQIKEFAALNGAFNTWPFFREHVFNLFGKMGLPPFSLPLFSANNRVEDDPAEVAMQNDPTREA
jgi:hypothetical protein